ncbi:MAG: hypothetical protein D6800_07650 [Candidatus Zixiibacteriota bacterium]|nr:MAG: hypothetical protein D6800_07650 [candidate division Zixibacteria bacterium]
MLWISYQGGWWLFGMVALFALIGTGEFLYHENIRPAGTLFWTVVVMTAWVWWQYGEMVTAGDNDDLALFQYLMVIPVTVVVFFLVTGIFCAIGNEPPAELFRRQTRLLWGFLYLNLLYPLVYLLGNSRLDGAAVSGGDLLLFLFAVLWIGDTAAMGVGKWLGRHQLAPAVSPNKTVEGFIGGLAGGVLIGGVMYFWKFSAVPWYHVLMLAFGCSFTGQLGDLVESMWKRSLGIKDSSAIIPGHGGVLDRFDSLLFAAPFMFAYLKSFIER